MGNLIQKFLPKQADIDKILKVIQRKVLKGTHLLAEIKEIQVGYLTSSYFKDIICICHRINYPLLKQQLERYKCYQKGTFYWTPYYLMLH